MLNAGNPSRRWATSHDWERLKDEISAVFQQGSLADLMAHMERNHHFQAT